MFVLKTLAAENHSEQANDSEPAVPPAIPSRPEHTKSKVCDTWTCFFAQSAL